MTAMGESAGEYETRTGISKQKIGEWRKTIQKSQK